MTDVTLDGPLFDGAAPLILDRYAHNLEEDLAQKGQDRIVGYLPTVYENFPVHSTGYYQSRINIERRMDSLVINDGDVVYGAWLEFGSHDERFAGYHAFRITAQQLDAEAGGVAETDLQPYIGELNS